jgi:hypothetical protein
MGTSAVRSKVCPVKYVEKNFLGERVLQTTDQCTKVECSAMFATSSVQQWQI